MNKKSFAIILFLATPFMMSSQNTLDSLNRRQGYWEEILQHNSDPPVLMANGSYVDNKREGVWMVYGFVKNRCLYVNYVNGEVTSVIFSEKALIIFYILNKNCFEGIVKKGGKVSRLQSCLSWDEIKDQYIELDILSSQKES